jgi:PAS domain S-box-containing protein
MTLTTSTHDFRGNATATLPALFLLDRNGAIAGWTAAAAALCGTSAEELRQTAFARLFVADAGEPDFALSLAEVGRDGLSTQGSLNCRGAGPTPVRAVIEPILGDAAQITGFAVRIIDLTGSSESEAALAESEQQFRILVQGVTDYAIYMLDPHGKITNWNAGGERIKGYSAEEIVGQHFSRFYAKEDQARGDPARTLSIAASKGQFEGEGWRVRKDGTRFWAGVVVDRILDKDGNLVGFAKITRDMTEKKKAEDALERARAALAQSQKMEAVGQLTGGVAHDFNNLLTVIANGLDLLSGPVRDGAQRRRIIESAQRATERGAKLTQQLLAFSRRQPLQPELHNINALIEGFEAVLRRASPEPIEVDLTLAEGPLFANIDGPQFETALLNLVIIARDAMAEHGARLTMVTGVESINDARAATMPNMKPGDYVTVSVADSGEGMLPEVLARAFEPFFTTKEIGRGSGLGLSQVHGFMSQSGGQVLIDSTLGLGTIVTLFLPAARPHGAAVADAKARAEKALARVLVVEDDPEVLDVTVESLRNLGYEVLTAPDGPSAISVLRRDPAIDILFSDVVMPRGMNGVELARNAVRLRPRLRILLASGYPMSALSSAHGVDDDIEFRFLNKPYRIAALAEALTQLQTN